METRAHYVVIGLFTVLVVVSALLFGLWLTHSGNDRQYKFYDVLFNEPVSGLSNGSAVQYSGIKVGDVSSLRLDPDNPSKVWARIRVHNTTPIKEDTAAKLTSTGITGTSIIQMSSGSASSPDLETSEDHVAVIVATPSPLNLLLANGEDLMTNVNEVVSRVNNLLSPANTKRFSNTLDHLDLATGAISSERESISLAVRELAQASKQANATLSRFNQLMDSEGSQIITNAGQAMASLQQVGDNLNRLINDNEQSVINGMNGLNELGPAIAELRQTLASLRAITRQLENNPAGYLFGREQIKEIQP